MDNELFELCKEVFSKFPNWWDAPTTFELTDGDNTGYIRPNIGSGQVSEWLFKPDPINKRPPAFLPLYTSDYLLEKLHEAGRSIEIDMFKNETIVTDRKPTNQSGDNDVYDHWTTKSGSTPLKALLKLTIALHEAGELK